MTPEDRLRSALRHRADRVEPSTDGLTRIEERLMDAHRNTNRNRVLLGVGTAAAVIAVVLGAAVLADDEKEVDTAGSTSTTTSAVVPTTADGTESTTTTVFVPTLDPAVPVWPLAHTARRFTDPVSAARSFATEFVGMTGPVVGGFQAGDARSGEVAVQPQAGGPVTTVLVRMLEDDTWFVIGAATDAISVDNPASGAGIGCPARLTGEALAFEGVVQVSMRADWVDEPIGTGFVQGGGGPAAPFDGSVDCDLGSLDDGVHYGTIIFSTEGGEDYRIWQFTVVRVALNK